MHNRKIALITVITGQDGTYLAEFLLDKGYEVHGNKRRTSLFNTTRIDHLYQDPHVKNRHFFLHDGDMTDSSSRLANLGNARTGTTSFESDFFIVTPAEFGHHGLRL